LQEDINNLKKIIEKRGAKKKLIEIFKDDVDGLVKIIDAQNLALHEGAKNSLILSRDELAVLEGVRDQIYKDSGNGEVKEAVELEDDQGVDLTESVGKEQKKIAKQEVLDNIKQLYNIFENMEKGISPSDDDIELANEILKVIKDRGFYFKKPKELEIAKKLERLANYVYIGPEPSPFVSAVHRMAEVAGKKDIEELEDARKDLLDAYKKQTIGGDLDTEAKEKAKEEIEDSLFPGRVGKLDQKNRERLLDFYTEKLKEKKYIEIALACWDKLSDQDKAEKIAIFGTKAKAEKKAKQKFINELEDKRIKLNGRFKDWNKKHKDMGREIEFDKESYYGFLESNRAPEDILNLTEKKSDGNFYFKEREIEDLRNNVASMKDYFNANARRESVQLLNERIKNSKEKFQNVKNEKARELVKDAIKDEWISRAIARLKKDKPEIADQIDGEYLFDNFDKIKFDKKSTKKDQEEIKRYLDKKYNVLVLPEDDDLLDLEELEAEPKKSSDDEDFILAPSPDSEDREIDLDLPDWETPEFEAEQMARKSPNPDNKDFSLASGNYAGQVEGIDKRDSLIKENINRANNFEELYEFLDSKGMIGGYGVQDIEKGIQALRDVARLLIEEHNFTEIEVESEIENSMAGINTITRMYGLREKVKELLIIEIQRMIKDRDSKRGLFNKAMGWLLPIDQIKGVFKNKKADK